jgi:transcriptional regulator with XRE-family HTH domain
METKTAVTPHIGRKIERIRTLRGIKQEALASKIGISQGALSKIEQSATIDDEKLKLIAEGLEMTEEAITTFNEDAFMNFINNIHSNSFDNHSIAFIYNQFNPIEKIVELYERMLESERKKNELYEQLLKNSGILK